MIEDFVKIFVQLFYINSLTQRSYHKPFLKSDWLSNLFSDILKFIKVTIFLHNLKRWTLENLLGKFFHNIKMFGRFVKIFS